MLTPTDIENKSFKKTKMKGYDIQDVEDFLEEVIEDYDKLYKENADLNNRIVAMQESVSYYKSLEEGINKTIENAQTTSDNILQAAKRDAESIKQEAEIESKKQIENLSMQISKKETELEEKKKQMKLYKIRVASMLEAQLKILNEDEE